MALSAEQIKGQYPLPAYNFQVVIEGSAAPVRFSRISGLEREHQTLTYRDGLSFLEGERIRKYFVDKYISITLEQGCVGKDAQLVTWLDEKDARAMQISLCDETGTPLVTWAIARALAVKLTAPSFDAQTNEVAIDRLELKVSGVSIVHH